MRRSSNNVKKAVIVAAGRSTRLHPLTLKKPKGLLKINNETLLARSTRLLKSIGIEKIAIVVGFEAQQIIDELGSEFTYILNPYYPLCNNMGSLGFAKEFIGEDSFAYLHSDVIFDSRTLQGAIGSTTEANKGAYLVTDFGPVDEEAMKVRTNREGLLVDASKEIPLHHASGEWIGLAVIHSSKRLFDVIDERLLGGNYNDYDVSAFVQLVSEGISIYCGSTNNLPWKEIDFVEDYEEAKLLFE